MLKTIIRTTPIGLPSIIVVAAIAYLSLANDPVGDNIMLFYGADKVAHFIMYFFATLVFINDVTRYKMPHHVKTSTMIAISCASAVLGLLMEVLQGILGTNREPDFLDALANTAGAFVAFMCAWLWLQHLWRKLMMGEYLRHHRHRKHKKSSATRRRAQANISSYQSDNQE